MSKDVCVSYSSLSRRLYIRQRAQLSLMTLVTFYAEAQYFEIAAGDADSVLNEFALQAGIEYSVDASLSKEKYSMGLQGDYQADEAFSLLLADIGLSAEKQNDGSYVVNSNDQWSLEAIDVGTRLDSAGQAFQTTLSPRYSLWLARQNDSGSLCFVPRRH